MSSLKQMFSEIREFSNKLMDTRDYTIFWSSENSEYFERILTECQECYRCKLRGCEQRKKHYAVAKKALKLAKLAYKDRITADEWMCRVEKLVYEANWDLFTFQDCPDSDRREIEEDKIFLAMFF